MIWTILVMVWYCIIPLGLHELGHWIMLKRYGFPFTCRLNVKRGLLIEFHLQLEDATIPDVVKALKIALFGAFPPLLVLTPLLIWFNWFFLLFSLFTCSIWAFWTIYETWLNLTALSKSMEQTK